MCTKTGYAFVDERWKRFEKVTRGDDKTVHIEAEDPEVSMCVSNHKLQTIRKVVAFSKKPANVDPIKHTTQNTPKPLKVPQQTVLALPTRDYKVRRSSQLDYTIVSFQQR